MTESNSSSVLLLDPYRSALMALAIKEKILYVPKDEDINSLPPVRIGRDEALQTAVLRMLLMFDDVAIVHHEQPGDYEEAHKKGISTLSAIRLQDMGLVRFTQVPADPERVARTQTCSTLEEIWHVDAAHHEVWGDYVASVVYRKGFISHPSLYFLLRAMRLGDSEQEEKAFALVPEANRQEADAMRKARGFLIRMVEFVIFTALNEVLEAEGEVNKTQCRIAHYDFAEEVFTGYSHKASTSVELVDTIAAFLLPHDLVLPVPATLEEARQLRKRSDIVDFRVAFQPWLSAVTSGNESDAKKLKRELDNAVRAFKNAPRVQRLNDIISYASVPIGAAPVIGPALGLVLGAATMPPFLPALAERLKKQGKWVGLVQKRTVDNNVTSR